MKMTMISVHSSGQPSMKMMNCARIMNCSGVRFIESTHFSITSWPPSSANAAEKMPEPTNSQHTMALVFAVRNDDSLTIAAELPRRAARTATRLSRARRLAPMTDVAVDEHHHEAAERAHRRRLGRASPGRTRSSRARARISSASGKNEVSSILNTSSRSQFQSQ